MKNIFKFLICIILLALLLDSFGINISFLSINWTKLILDVTTSIVIYILPFIFLYWFIRLVKVLESQKN